jgi:hypothetical protein
LGGLRTENGEREKGRKGEGRREKEEGRRKKGRLE